MSAIETVTAAAIANGWQARENRTPGSKSMVYTKGERTFYVSAHPNGTIDSGALDDLVIKGRDKTARIVGFLKTY